MWNASDRTLHKELMSHNALELQSDVRPGGQWYYDRAEAWQRTVLRLKVKGRELELVMIHGKHGSTYVVGFSSHDGKYVLLPVQIE